VAFGYATRDFAMAQRSITEIHHHERRALALLRAGTPDPSLPAAAVVLFATLRTSLSAHPIELRQPGTRWVGEEEVLVLSWLAMAQRSRGGLPTGLSTALVEALHRCAAVLADAKIALPFRTVARGAGRAGPATDTLESNEPQAAIVWPTDRPAAMRARARTVLQQRGIASTSDFVASGVSRQCVSNLCKAGYIERVHVGWYRARTTPAPQAAGGGSRG
jgi:hypothetical protein